MPSQIVHKSVEGPEGRAVLEVVLEDELLHAAPVAHGRHDLDLGALGVDLHAINVGVLF
jgi:hypothetical protein